MKPLENVWSGLLQRRLLPVAILLVAALAAIPLLLTKDAEPVAPAAPAAAKDASTGAATADTVVTLAETGGEAAPRRRVLGASKNPFQPGPGPKADATATPGPGTQVSGPSLGGGNPDGKPADVPAAPTHPVGVPVGPSNPAPTDSQPKPTYELYSLTVRFGDSASDTLERSNLARLKALPSADDPVLVYLGPGKGAKTAIFMVDEGVLAQGDADCQPSPNNCETISMSEGETEFLDVIDEDGNVGAQYQLDLVDIKTSKTADASKAAKSRAKSSKAGRSIVRARQAAAGPLRYRYDAKSGTVRKIGKRAYKALQAKSARVALATAGGF